MDKEDIRLPDRDPKGTDNLLVGLSTLTSQDVKDMQSEVKGPQTATSAGSEMKKDSPHTAQYLRLVKSLFGKSADIFLDSGTANRGNLSRSQLYHIYDDMDNTEAFISSALDIVSDDATQPDIKGNIITVRSENDKVTSILENLFDSLDIESRLPMWARAIIKYGDLFIKVYGSTEKGNRGISSIDDTIYPSYLERKDFRGKLVAFNEITSGELSADSLVPPWDYVHFRYKGDLTSSTSKSSYGEDTTLDSSYGQSILRSAVKVYTQLRFSENMILLSRLTNSVRRNVFLINVGETEPNAAFETIANYADVLKKDIKLDLDDSIYNSSKHTVAYDEDIFLPVSDPKNDVSIQSIGGDSNISEQYDLEYLRNKLFAALKIPKAYLNYEQDLNARSTLIQLDIRYARTVSQVQKTLIAGLTRLAKIHLAYIGLDPEDIDFEIYMTSVSAIDEEARLEQQSQRIQTANDYLNLINTLNDMLVNSQHDPSEDVTEEGSPLGSDVSGGGSTSPIHLSNSDAIDAVQDDLEPNEQEDLSTDNTATPEEVADQVSVESKLRAGKKLRESKFKPIQKYDSPIDLEYLTRKMLTEYLDFSEDEVDTVFGSKKKDSITPDNERPPMKTKLQSNRRIFKGHVTHTKIYDDTDIDYPTDLGRRFYESTTKSLVTPTPESIEESSNPDTEL